MATWPRPCWRDVPHRGGSRQERPSPRDDGRLFSQICLAPSSTQGCDRRISKVESDLLAAIGAASQLFRQPAPLAALLNLPQTCVLRQSSHCVDLFFWRNGKAMISASVVAKALERCRRRAAYSSLPAFLLPIAFTQSALRQAYEAVLGRMLNDSAFRRKIDELRGIDPVIGAVSKASARPAQLYRLSREHIVEFDRTL